MLDHGRIVAEGTPDELKRRVPGGHVRLELADGQIQTIPHDGSVASLRELFARLDDEAVDVAGLTVHTPDLDDVFFALTGHDTKENV